MEYLLITFLDLCSKIVRAECAEDIFGEEESDVRNKYLKFSVLVHPDKNLENKGVAEEATKLLTKFYREAQEKIKGGIYGRRIKEEQNRFIIKTLKREYIITSVIGEGDLSIVYKGEYISDGNCINTVAVKVFSTDFGDLAQNELRILKIWESESITQSKHLPILIDRFKTVDGNLGLVLRWIDGYDMYSVREKYKEGVDRKHVVWMFSRLLSVLGYIHNKGIIHGNIEPGHFMIRPKDHNGWLIDWSYAIRDGEKFRIYNEDFSAPEVKEKKSPLPSSDLYSAGKLMIYIY